MKLLYVNQNRIYYNNHLLFVKGHDLYSTRLSVGMNYTNIAKKKFFLETNDIIRYIFH